MMRGELERVEAHARIVAGSRSERVEVGPFDVFFTSPPPAAGPDDDPDEVTAAYAIPARPTGDQTSLRADLAALVEAFRARGAVPRVELTLFLWPELPGALAAAGLVQVEDSPLFVVDPTTFRPRITPALTARFIAAGESPAFALSLVRQGFELRGPPPAPEEVAALRESLDGPLRLAVANLDGRPAGAGFSMPAGDATEISGLATLPTQRRHGVATGITSFLVGEHFRGGGEIAWGVTDDPRVAGLLFGLGFHDAGLRVGWTLREETP
jgi:hypothetical protein